MENLHICKTCMIIAYCLISLISDRICFHQLLDSAFINVTRVTLTVGVTLE